MRAGLFLPLVVCLAGCSSSLPKPPMHPMPTFGKAPAPPASKTAARAVKAAARFKARNPDHSLLGRWTDDAGAVYNFHRRGQVTWSRPIGNTAANFRGKFNLNQDQLVIVPESGASPSAALKKQFGFLSRRRRISQYSLRWQSDGSISLAGNGSTLHLTAVQ